MQRAILTFFVLFLIPSLTNAGIPISQKKTSVTQKKVVKKSEGLTKKRGKLSFVERRIFKRVLKKYGRESRAANTAPIFNALSMTLGMISFASLIAAAFAASMALVYVAFGLGVLAIIFGILGLAKKEGLRGLSITGIILGGIGFTISLLVALIDSSI